MNTCASSTGDKHTGGRLCSTTTPRFRYFHSYLTSSELRNGFSGVVLKRVSGGSCDSRTCLPCFQKSSNTADLASYQPLSLLREWDREERGVVAVNWHGVDNRGLRVGC